MNISISPFKKIHEMVNFKNAALLIKTLSNCF